MSGDKSGDMLKGDPIIGGIIGNNVGNVENGGAIPGNLSLVVC